MLIVFSILSPLENIMKSILDFFHGSAGLPWAWSIVALTILVRIVLVPRTVRQIHSMQSLQAHAPEMKALQQKYKGDRQKLAGNAYHRRFAGGDMEIASALGDDGLDEREEARVGSHRTMLSDRSR